MTTTASTPCPKREHDERGERDDRDRLARDDVRHERPLREPRVDEHRREAEAEQARRARTRGTPRARCRARPRRGSRPSVWSAPRWNGWPHARTTMFQTWGRLRSFANGQRNGGFQMTGEPGPAPTGTATGRRRGASTPSQRSRTRAITTRKATGRRHRRRGIRGWAASISSSSSRSSRWISFRSAPADTRSSLSVVGCALARDRLVGDVEGAIDDLEALGELLLGDAQRRVGVDRVVGDRSCTAPLSRRNLPIAFISSEVPLYGVSGVHGSRLADEVEDPEQAEVAVRADARVLRGERLVVARA